jgi:lipoate-protein ligase A
MIWRFIGYQKNSAYENMAIDEAVFRETLKKQKPPTLRFYGWRPAAVSIGYFQELEKEIDLDFCRRSGVDIVRRLTGGKAVFHGDEITYSLAAGISESIFSDNIIDTYEKISICLARGLSRIGIHAHLAIAKGNKEKDPEMASCCFYTPSGNELLVSGRKICGSAQARKRDGFLQHGSLLMTFDPDRTSSLILGSQSPERAARLKDAVAAVNELIPSPIDEEALCSALKDGFSDHLGVELFEGSLTPEEEQLSGLLVEKYKSDAWNRERKKDSFEMG